MSLYDFRKALELRAADVGIYALLMAAAMKADTENFAKLRAVFPALIAEVDVRYNAPGGLTPSEAEAQAAREVDRG